MNRRSHLQLRLQQTVEGLSVVAIGYYALSLMAYGFDAAKALGVPVNKDIATGIAMPIVLVAIYLGMHSIRTRLTKQSHKATKVKKRINQKKAESKQSS